MSILDELKRLILARHGSTAGVRSIADAVKVLVTLEEGDSSGAQTIAQGVKAMWVKETGWGNNPLTDLDVTGDFTATTEQLLGKALTDLQEDIDVDMDTCKITGTCKYVTGYTGFSGNPAEQEGHYLALYVDVDDVTGITYTCELSRGPVTLDSDQIIIRRIDGKLNVPFVVTASKTGYDTVVRTFDLSSLILAPET